MLNAKSKKEYFDGAVKLYCKAGEIRWTDLSEITKGKDIVDKYKVFISKSAGSPGKDLKIIGTPYIGERGTACTDSLFPIGDFDTFDEANNLQKYIKTQFLRFMVSIMKISQNVTQLVYKFVPLQDFTRNSDIDWSKSIHEIDLQLYRKMCIRDRSSEVVGKIKSDFRFVIVFASFIAISDCFHRDGETPLRCPPETCASAVLPLSTSAYQ